MNAQQQIDDYIRGQPQAKREEMEELHRRILAISPNCRLWFSDGRDSRNKIVSNPNIGYGLQTKRYANGDTKEFYRIGLSANTTGISVYVMGLDDKTYLSRTYGPRLGRAKITGYCVKFRSTKDLDLGVLEEMIASRMNAPAS